MRSLSRCDKIRRGCFVLIVLDDDDDDDDDGNDALEEDIVELSVAVILVLDVVDLLEDAI